MSSAPRLEFFFDRSLGKETANQLRALAWRIHLIADEYPNDAQQVEDEDWIAEGSRRHWVLLTKDKKIRYRGAELAALYGGRLFCLSNGNLTTTQMVDRFDAAARRIETRAMRHHEGFWQVYDGGEVKQKWP